MAVYPRHKQVVDRFAAQGVVLGIGPFSDGENMAIFKTRDAAEAFSKGGSVYPGRTSEVVLAPGLGRRYVARVNREAAR